MAGLTTRRRWPPLSQIFGQRLDGITGAEVGQNDMRLSDMGDDTETDPQIRDDYFASEPRVCWNPDADEYLVIWSGEDDIAPLVNGEFEIFGQRIAGVDGSEVGENDFRISDMGDDGESDAAKRGAYRASRPHVAYSTSSQVFLVVWEGDDDSTNPSDATLVDGEIEAFASLLPIPKPGPAIVEVGPVSVFMDEDGDPTPFSLTLNATGADADDLTWSIQTPAAHGVATASGTGSSKAIGYAPNPDFHGSDSFSVRVFNADLDTDSITVDVTVEPVNDAPVAVADSFLVAADSSENLLDVLANDTDVDTGDVLSVVGSAPDQERGGPPTMAEGWYIPPQCHLLALRLLRIP